MFSPRAKSVSINLQLLIAVVLATAVASTVAAGFSLWREVGAYAGAKRIEAEATAGLIASVSSDAVRDRDEHKAHLVLKGMSSMPSVTHVRLLDSQGAILAQHGYGARLIREQNTEIDDGWRGRLALLSGDPISVAAPVVHAGEQIGSITLLMSTDDLFDRVWSLILNATAATLIAMLIGSLAARSLRRRVSTRIGTVAGAMAVVQRTHSYDLTLPNDRADELGVLVEGFNGMMREIRLRDRRLAEHRDNLEIEVANRTQDLVVAKQAADDANLAKSQFLATMSHEIRTPLNGLMVMAELLAAADLDQREKRYADVIMRSGGTLLAIINDVLDFSKIEAGKIDLETIPLDLADVIDDVGQLFATKAAQQGLDLAAFVSPALGTVHGDPVRIGQIVGNLVNNAIKFTSAGHVLIEAQPDPIRPGHIHISVSDTGIGIPADKLGSIFDSFSQADQSTTRRYGGTGLGLSICQKLVTVMGGEIGVQSKVGAGSRFWFSVPMKRSPATAWPALGGIVLSRLPGATQQALERYTDGNAVDPAERPIVIIDPMHADASTEAAGLIAGGARVLVLSRLGDASADAWVADGRALGSLAWPVRRRELVQAIDDARLGRKPGRQRSTEAATPIQHYASAKVLVVDDSPVNREVAAEALKRFGIIPEMAVDGPSAIALAAGGGYDLILMDGSMPGMSGFDASRAIRSQERQRQLKRQAIVALTAHALSDARDQWLAADMDGLLIKPFNLAQLGERLARHLRPSGAAPKAAQPAEERPRPPTALGPSPEPAEPSAAEHRPTPPILDDETITMLGQMAAADPAAVKRIIELFVEHAPPALEAVAAAWRDGDPTAFASAVHALKSMALSVGAHGLAHHLQPIEKAAREQALMPAKSGIEQIAQGLSEAITALRTLPWMGVAAQNSAAA